MDKNSGPILNRLWTKLHNVLTRCMICRRHLVVSNTLAKLSKKVSFGLPIVRGKRYPDFGQMFSNCTHFRASGQFWLSSV